jgi:2-polyprenyl-3-methyl-5-hydroxy-6-metoxy-1,4-benzoquinol methylase
MSNQEYKCLVCHSVDSESFLECKDHFVSQENFNILRCSNCGFLFTAPVPALSEMGKYYKSDKYISHSDTQKGLINKIYHKVRDIMLNRKRKLIDRESNGKVLLDIGCGTGYFPDFMKNKGYQVSGMELDDDAREFARNNFNLDVYHPEDLLTKTTKNTYDVITLWHVLEHLHESDRYIKWIKEALKDKGVLVIALPNCDSYDANSYNKFWAAYDVPRHLWHFKPDTFEAYMSGFGFALKKVKRLPFDAYYNSLMSAKYAGKFSPMIHGFFTGWISNLLSLPNSKKTSSVIYILRKAE